MNWNDMTKTVRACAELVQRSSFLPYLVSSFMGNVGVEWTPGKHTTNMDLRRTAGVGLEGREATLFIS